MLGYRYSFHALVLLVLVLFTLSQSQSLSADSLRSPLDALIVSESTGTVNSVDPCPVPRTSAVYRHVQKAIDCAFADDFVSILSGQYPEAVTITKNLTLEGLTSSMSRIGFNLSSSTSVISISGAITVNLSNIGISRGGGMDGAGIHVSGATVNLTNVSLNNNFATHHGGSLYVTDDANVLILKSAITHSSATEAGGGIYVESGSVTVANSTISTNGTETGSGSGIYVENGTVDLINATVANHEAPAIHNEAGIVKLSNTIVGTGGCSGAITSLGYNVADDSTCNLIATGDKPNVDPLLDALGNFTATPSHRLLPGSPALSAGSNTVCMGVLIAESDQINATRPNIGSRCDIGSLESNYLPNLIQNGDFRQPIGDVNGNWGVFAEPSDGIQFQTTNGIFEFYRAAGSSQAAVLQQTGIALPANQHLSLEFMLGNSSQLRKRLTVLIHDADFSDFQVCTFWLRPNTPFGSQPLGNLFQMNIYTTEAWTNATVSFYPSSADGVGFFQVDNVKLFADQSPDTGSICIYPQPPPNEAGLGLPNFIDNGSFDNPIGNADGNWGVFATPNEDSIQYRVEAGVFEFYRVIGGTSAVVLQNDSSVNEAGRMTYAEFQLGNTSAERQRVTVFVHAADFSDFHICTFWLAPNTPLTSYTMRTFPNQDWTAGSSISFYASTSSTTGWIQLDNVSVYSQNDGFITRAVNCTPSTTTPLTDTASSPLAPMLLPTATAFSSLPFDPAPIMTATPPVESSPDEGTFSE